VGGHVSPEIIASVAASRKDIRQSYIILVHDDKMKKSLISLLVLLIIFLIATILFFIQSQTNDEKDLTAARGVFSLGVEKMTDAKISSLLQNENVDGFSLRAGWDEIEPREGQYNWEVFDRVIKQTQSSNKKIMLRVIAGTSSPDWIYTAGAQKLEYTDDNANHESYEQKLFMPLPWDSIYLAKWKNFVSVFGEKYNDNPQVILIQMTGPAKAGEMHLVEKDNETFWSIYNYTDAKLENAWKETIDAYSSAFPNKQIAIDIAKPLNFGNSWQAVQDIVAYIYEKRETHFAVQGNFLAAKTPENFQPYALIKSYKDKTTGFQMLAPFTGDGGARLGGTLREAIDKGLAVGADYIEIYSADVENPQLADDIKYAHDEMK
jgi:hypothetical protein